MLVPLAMWYFQYEPGDKSHGKLHARVGFSLSDRAEMALEAPRKPSLGCGDHAAEGSSLSGALAG